MILIRTASADLLPILSAVTQLDNTLKPGHIIVITNVLRFTGAGFNLTENLVMLDLPQEQLFYEMTLPHNVTNRLFCNLRQTVSSIRACGIVLNILETHTHEPWKVFKMVKCIKMMNLKCILRLINVSAATHQILKLRSVGRDLYGVSISSSSNPTMLGLVIGTLLQHMRIPASKLIVEFSGTGRAIDRNGIVTVVTRAHIINDCWNVTGKGVDPTIFPGVMDTYWIRRNDCGYYYFEDAATVLAKKRVLLKQGVTKYMISDMLLDKATIDHQSLYYLLTSASDIDSVRLSFETTPLASTTPLHDSRRDPELYVEHEPEALQMQDHANVQ